METKTNAAVAKATKTPKVTTIGEIFENITKPGRSPQMLGKDVKALIGFGEIDVKSYFRSLSTTQEQKILTHIENFPNLLKLLKG